MKTPQIFILILVYCNSIVAADFTTTFWKAESIFRNMVNAREKLKVLRDVFVAALEEDCIFSCPEDMKPDPRPDHIPTSDGCGTPGLKDLSEFTSLEEITKCCNHHDICYDTCNSNKDDCDQNFKRCLYDHCNFYKPYNYVLQVCKTVAKTFYSATSTLGCKSYLDSQRNACLCPPKIKYKRYSLRDGDL